MRAKRFFYVCAGILMLAIAYHFGASRAGAQSPGQFAGIAVNSGYFSTVAITSTGDMYATANHVIKGPDGQPRWSDGVSGSPTTPTWNYMGSVLGGPIQVEGTSITDVKKKFREEE